MKVVKVMGKYTGFLGRQLCRKSEVRWISVVTEYLAHAAACHVHPVDDEPSTMPMLKLKRWFHAQLECHNSSRNSSSVIG